MNDNVFSTEMIELKKEIKAVPLLLDKIEDWEKLAKMLWDMLSVADVWTECDDCSKVWEECHIHKYCKVFFNSDTLEEFAKKIKEIPA